MGYRQTKALSSEHFYGTKPTRNDMEPAEKGTPPWEKECLRTPDGKGFEQSKS